MLALLHLTEHLRQGAEAKDGRLLAALAQRGLDATELERLARLVAVAQSVEAGSTEEERDDESRETEHIALYAWYREWAETARQVVTRRD